MILHSTMKKIFRDTIDDRVRANLSNLRDRDTSPKDLSCLQNLVSFTG